MSNTDKSHISITRHFKDGIKNMRFLLRDTLFNKKNRKALQNKNFSIIGSDCTAGCVCKDLRIKMNSPTRNFYFEANDYIKFCQNLPYYLSLSLSDDSEPSQTEYLTAMCGDIRLFLVHYDSVQQAKEEWERRKGRVNLNNLFFLMNDRNNCSEETIKAFDELPYPNKICFTHQKYPQYKSAYYIPGSEDSEYLESLMTYIHPWWIKRYYDYFDFVSWLNHGVQSN